VADENIDRQIVERLRQEGHLIWYVAEMDPGISDQDVLNLANHEHAILLTADKDFGELVYRQRLINPGVILLRLSGLLPTAKAELVLKEIAAHMKEIRGSFVVLSHRTIRIRQPKTQTS
jgi:predicted nuclease of predicted toxin-antitoxin system